MALDFTTRYPGQIDSDAAYPYGKARNIVTENDGTGTPWEKDLVNDLFGLMQSLLVDAGITPAGAPDSVGASQYLEALRTLARKRAAAEAIASAEVVLEHTSATDRDPVLDVCFGPGAGPNKEGYFLSLHPTALNETVYRFATDGRFSATGLTIAAWLPACAHGGLGTIGNRYFMMVGGTSASGAGKIYRIGDTFSSLDDQTPTPQPGKPLEDVVFNGTRWCACGYYDATNNAQFLVSADDGATWSSLAAASGFTGNFQLVHVVQAGPNAGRVLAFGDDAEIQAYDGSSLARVFSSADSATLGLATWTTVEEIDGVILAGAGAGSGCMMARTLDGGDTWEEYSTVPAAPAESFVPDRIDHLMEFGGVLAAHVSQPNTDLRHLWLFSRDRGATWEWTARVPRYGQARSYLRGHASDGERLVLVGGTALYSDYGYHAVTQAVL